jgi:hypothetical protein
MKCLRETGWTSESQQQVGGVVVNCISDDDAVVLL